VTTAPTRRLAGEFALIFLAAPLLVLAVKSRLLMFVLLWTGALIAARALPADAGAVDVRRELRGIALRFAMLAPLITLLTWLALPEAFLSFPRQRPWLWLTVMTLYPVLSVWPQEMIFRRFLRTRYAPLFGTGRGYLAASALAFGYAHIVLLNGVAVAMTALGGALLAANYARHRRLVLVCLEHALYGCLIFTVGLGRFFFSGAVWH